MTATVDHDNDDGVGTVELSIVEGSPLVIEIVVPKTLELAPHRTVVRILNRRPQLHVAAAQCICTITHQNAFLLTVFPSSE